MSERPWRLAHLLSAPHRLGFAVGAALMSVLALWWLAVLIASRLGAAPSWPVPPTLAHGLLFTLGFMPAFMAGFLFTAGPRWLGQPEVDARALLTALLQFGAGWLMALVGMHAGVWLAAFGAATAASGWMRLSLRLAALLRASRASDRLHARWMLLACFVGVAAMLLACGALLQDDASLLHGAVQLGLWGFIAPVFAAASHRMLPFVNAAAWPLLGGLALAGLAEMAWLPPWLLAPSLAIASLALLAQAWRWQRAQKLKGESQRLLAMLHGGFVWLGASLGLQAASQTLQATGLGGLGAAPLHALTLGWLGCTLIAMVTRATATHSGRARAVDGFGWGLYRWLQLGVLLRVAGALGLGLVPPAAVWAAVTAAWTWRYGAWLGRPNADLSRPY